MIISILGLTASINSSLADGARRNAPRAGSIGPLLLVSSLMAVNGACDKPGKSCSKDADCGAGSTCNRELGTCLSPPERALAISTNSLPEGIARRPYEFTMTADGGTGPLRWSLVNQPPQLSWVELGISTGRLSGTPYAAQSSALVVQVADSAGRSDVKTLILSVRSCNPGESFDCTAPLAQACYNGRQSCTDAGALAECIPSATPSNDLQKCGVACAACSRGADRCQAGICRCGPADACGSGAPQCCNAADGGTTCVDTERDPDFCGSCSVSCDRDRVHVIRSCDAGCDYPCVPGWARCPVGSRDPDCQTDLTSPENCGACGRRCPIPDGGFARCTQGTCEQVCPGGQACDGTCYPLNDVNHCGNCATRCTLAADGGATCDGAPLRCRMTCYGSDRLCAAACVRIDDVNHCGGCGQVCHVTGGTPLCPGGTCIGTCPGDLHLCGSGLNYYCAAFDDINNCGGCGQVCRVTGGTPRCPGGTCSGTCPPGYNLCGSGLSYTCYSLDDPNHCGDCTTQCLPDQICEGGTCRDPCPRCIDGRLCCPPDQCIEGTCFHP